MGPCMYYLSSISIIELQPVVLAFNGTHAGGISLRLASLIHMNATCNQSIVCTYK